MFNSRFDSLFRLEEKKTDKSLSIDAKKVLRELKGFPIGREDTVEQFDFFFARDGSFNTIRRQKPGRMPRKAGSGNLGLFGGFSGFFPSDAPSNVLDVVRSVEATSKRGVAPSMVFENRKKVRRVLVLIDFFSESLWLNPVSFELAQGLSRLGVPFFTGWIKGSADMFYDDDGFTFFLDDLEEVRKECLLLIFSDGKSFYETQGISSLAGLFIVDSIASLQRCRPLQGLSLYEAPVFAANGSLWDSIKTLSWGALKKLYWGTILLMGVEIY